MKKQELLFTKLAKYYDFIYGFKNYEEEAQEIKSLIEKLKTSKGNSLLDVACGTGKHLYFLKDAFKCMGVDISDEMLKIARKHIPDIELKKSDMVHMNLGQKFDIITCLFSAINYVKTYDNLKKTCENFAHHLKQGGVAIIEPWVKFPLHKVAYPYDDGNTQITKLFLFKMKRNLAVFDFHYLIAEKNQHVQYFQDHHELGVFDMDKTLKIMTQSGFKASYFPHKQTHEQGLYIGVKK